MEGFGLSVEGSDLEDRGEEGGVGVEELVRSHQAPVHVNLQVPTHLNSTHLD